ncbi:MAG TPA: class I SAM-dependent rRNA methyltransferase [Anaerolineae bacterium]|nr:class I SAM-dependent rRNA methyltransferase [Anaerolineae bacterium]
MQHLRRGHPWIYRNRLSDAPDLPSGTWVQVRCARFTGYGLWDAKSPIAVRVFSPLRLPDAEWVSQQVQQAWALREPLRTVGTSAYRWLYGEGDGVPGVVVDLYGHYAVVQTYAESVEAILDWVVGGLRSCAELKGILFRGEDVHLLWGRRPPRDLIVEENGLRFYVDLFAGQKTGLYLDHREHRSYLEQWCAGKCVLNCFAYTGAFAVYAVRGGASEVVSVDAASPAVGEVRRNLELNGFDPEPHPTVVADCFELLEQYAAQGRQFDVVILDPPALARSRKSYEAAVHAYTRLNQAAIGCLPAGGLLATASCTAQVSVDVFRSILADAAARAQRRLFIVHQAGQAIDHPVPAHFPEGRYLKFVLAVVRNLA